MSLKQSHSAVRHNNGSVSGSATNWPIKQTSQKASLSLSPSPPTSLSPPHPPPHPLDIPPHKHALKVPITFVRNNNKLFFPRDSCVNEVSECLEGNFKIIRNCTTTSPTKCKGCAEGHYFDPGYGEHGGCIRCSKPCGIFQKETKKCETAHDRLCTARKLIDILGKSKPIKPRALKMPGHLRPYVLLFFISYINLFVYLFPIDVKCENLLLSFGSTYLFRIIHKSFSIYHCKGWGSGYIACFTSRLLIYKKTLLGASGGVKKTILNMFISCFCGCCCSHSWFFYFYYFLFIYLLFKFSSSVCVSK